MSETPQPSITPTESSSTPRAASTTRPSRQSLVEPPRAGTSGLLLAIGSVACAAAGFAAVWSLGLGRAHRDDLEVAAQPADHAVPTSSVTDDTGASTTVAAVPPRFFVPPNDVEAAVPRTAAVDPDAAKSRFTAEPASLEATSGDAAEGPPASRLSSFTDGRQTGAAEPAATEATHAEPQKEPQAETANASASPDASAEEPPAETTPPESPDAASPSTASPETIAAEAPKEAPPSPAPLRSPPLESTFAAALAPLQQQAAVARQPAASPAPAQPASTFHDPEAPIPVTAPEGSPPRPAGERLASTNVASGFGAIPPVGPGSLPGSTPASPNDPRAESPTNSASQSPESPSPETSAAALSTAAGLGGLAADGRPGPIQLEGIQTPQLTIEKRGPREVQVGKTARYDMIVRNVGSAVAHDVTLRDRVPLGAKLLATSPPAAPGDQGELVWSLGALPQGGQARVAMEVIPVEEGELGSVASVSFRADASVRSVATRAALAIEVAPPRPVLVGASVDLPITIRNPGSGEATGVVLEGVLPKGFTHASGAELEFDVGRLRPGESKRVDLRLASTHPGVQNLVLSARADGRVETEHSVRLEVTAPTLELTARMPNRRYLQRPATCVLSMANAGTAPARTVELAAQLPPGMKFLRANNAGYYEESTHRVLWHLEELPAAEIGSVEMVLMPTELGPQRIAAAARAADGLTSQVVHTVEVEGLAAVLFEVGDSEDPIEVDGITEYVVRVGNQGTKPATGVRVTATLLGDLEPLDAKGPVGHRVENLTVLFEPLAKLAPAEESVYRIRVRGRREGDQRVQVQVTSDDSQAPITKEEVTRVYADR